MGKPVTVTSSNNNPPEAFAGYNQVVLVNSTVISSHAYISDSDEEDRERLTYEWEQIEGPEVRLISISPRTTLFTAPSTAGTLKFRLTATDPGRLQGTDEMWVKVYTNTQTSEWVDTNVTDRCGAERRRQQTRLVNGVYENRWRDDPEESIWGEWMAIGTSGSHVYGEWADIEPEDIRHTGVNREKKQVRDVTVGVEKRRTDQCGNLSEPRTFPESFEDVQWRPYPELSVRAAATQNSVTLRWGAAPNAAGYDIEIGIPAGAGGLGHTEHTATGTSVTILDLQAGTTYEYRVRARYRNHPPGPWTSWATVATQMETSIILPPPTNSQWSARYENNKIQVKVTTRPSVTPEITHVGVLMETGQPPNLTTITKRVTASLNEWITVLSSTDTGYQQGRWVVHIRFENSVGESRYVLPGKLVIVPTTPPPPPPPPLAVVLPKPTNDQWNVRRSTDGIYANVVSLPTVSPAISEVQVRLQIDTSTVTATLGITLDNSYDKVLADDSSNWQTGEWSVSVRFRNSNGYGPYSDVKMVLVADRVPTGRTRNRTETDWVDTGRTQTDPVEDFDEKEQRRLVTYEQEEELRPNPDNEPNRWVLIREFKYRWVRIQDPPTHRWTFVEHQGCGPSREKIEACSNGHPRHTRRRSAPEDYIWGPWTNVGSPVIVYGSYSNVGSPQLISGTCKQRKIRNWTRSQRQQSRNQCGGAKFQSVTTTGTEFNFDTVSETWGSWTDTGQTREHPVELIVEKEQERFSSPCNRRQTQWVVVG